VALAVPPLPDALRGAEGCLLQVGIFDQAVGKEVYLLILEERASGGELVTTRPFRLQCASGLGNTSHGPVLFIIWTAATGSPQETQYEQFMNPTNRDTLTLLDLTSRQKELKVVVLDSAAGEILDFFMFENDFRFDRLIEPVEKIIQQGTSCDFRLAMLEFQRQYPTQKLKGR